jgi:hypothetical protein
MTYSTDGLASRIVFCCIFLTFGDLDLQPASAKLLAFNSIKIKEPNFCSCYMSIVLTDVNESCACITEGRFWPGL